MAAAVPPFGVCHAERTNTTPREKEVVLLCGKHNIRKMRIYDSDPIEMLKALKGSNIEVMLNVPDRRLASIASNTAQDAAAWVENYVQDFYPNVKIKYIVVGNAVNPTDPTAKVILPAMINIHNAISAAGYGDQIKVTTAIDSQRFVGYEKYPSDASFKDVVWNHLSPIINFLIKKKAPLLLNLCPYGTYVANKNQDEMQLPYALFTEREPVVTDNDLGYGNLFDAMLDSLYCSLEKKQVTNLEIVVSESGWPSAGGVDASLDNATTYYEYLVEHIRKKEGTPKKPGMFIELYLYAMFDKNQNVTGSYGIFDSLKKPKYNIF